MKRINSPKRSVLLQFTLSYVCVMIVSFVMGVGMYQISYRNAENQSIQFSSVLLDQTCETIEKSLSEAVSFSYMLNSISDWPEMNQAGLSKGDLTMNIQSIAKSLPSFSDTSGLITRYFVYSDKSNTIVEHGSGYLNLKDYYRTSFAYDDMSYDEWYSSVLKEENGVLLPAKSNRYTNKEYHSFLYIQPIVLSNKSYTGRIFFFFDSDILFNMIASVYEYGVNGIAVYNKQGLLLASDGSVDFPEKAISTGTVARGRDSVIISSPLSTRAQIRLVINIPSSYFASRLSSLRTMLLIGTGSMLLIGIFVDFWLLRMSHRPLKKND